MSSSRQPGGQAPAPRAGRCRTRCDARGRSALRRAATPGSRGSGHARRAVPPGGGRRSSWLPLLKRRGRTRCPFSAFARAGAAASLAFRVAHLLPLLEVLNDGRVDLVTYGAALLVKHVERAGFERAQRLLDHFWVARTRSAKQLPSGPYEKAGLRIADPHRQRTEQIRKRRLGRP